MFLEDKTTRAVLIGFLLVLAAAWLFPLWIDWLYAGPQLKLPTTYPARLFPAR
jgi:hypothetical protein